MEMDIEFVDLPLRHFHTFSLAMLVDWRVDDWVKLQFWSTSHKADAEVWRLAVAEFKKPESKMLGWFQRCLVGGLEHGFYFSIYWEFHHPNWRTPSVFRWVQSTNQMYWNHFFQFVSGGLKLCFYRCGSTCTFLNGHHPQGAIICNCRSLWL